VEVWEQPAYHPGGAVQGKAMSFYAHRGHPWQDFLVEPFLKAHPEFIWQAPLLRDMKSGPRGRCLKPASARDS